MRSPLSLIAIRQSAITHRRQAVVRDIPNRQHTCFQDWLLARAQRSFASSPSSHASQLSASSIRLIAAGDGGGSRKRGGSCPTRNSVINNLLARARTDVLAAGVTPDDRGSGIVTAPQ
jgi:hypothetical protein